VVFIAAMIYFLSREHHSILWNKSQDLLSTDDVEVLFLPKWKLLYRESNNEDELDYWGSVEGEEKDINWFLLNL
jgi:ABC-type uncharacterized transport system ATPase subunit